MNMSVQTEAADELLLQILDDYVKQRSSGSASRSEFLLNCRDQSLDDSILQRLPGLLDSLDALHGFACVELDVNVNDFLVPKVLGDYQIIREIGRGGMGIVYEAEQTSVGRKVALKVLPSTLAVDAQQLSRFLIEIQAAGGLNHPNIVPIYWAGHIDGVHCYAMPMIDGTSLDRLAYEDQVNESVALFVQAARAINHAHQYGVIHRDIKPSNLMVDRDGKIWVTDFGLARLSRDLDRSDVRSDITRSGAVVGTARYMSPEQADASRIVDHRCDIYSLGVTLAEMLTGVRFENVQSVPLRGPARHNKRISRDLETVVMKAIAADRDDRYRTASDFADDLQRILDSRPVLARRPSIIDRTWKWTLRHRRLVAASVLLVGVALFASVSMALVFAKQKSELTTALSQSDQNLRLADANLQRAEDNFRETRRVLDHFGLLAAERLRGVAGAEAIREQLVRDLLLYYERFVDSAASAGTLQRELADTHLRAARIIEEVGATEKALRAYRRAEALLGELPPSPTTLNDLVACRNSIAVLLAEQGDVSASEAMYRETIIKTSNDLSKALFAETRGNLGTLLVSLDRRDEARQEFELAVQLIQGEADVASRLQLAALLSNLSHLAMDADLDQSLLLSDQAIDSLRDVAVDDPAGQQALARSLNNRATIEMKMNRADAAASSYRESIRLQRKLLEDAPMVVQYSEDLAITYNHLGRVLQTASKTDEANAAIRSARRLMQSLVSRLPQQTRYQEALAGIEHNLRRIQP